MGEVHGLNDIGVDDVDCRHTVASQLFGHDRSELPATTMMTRHPCKVRCVWTGLAGAVRPKESGSQFG
jgi:hypothetical protein